MYIKSIMLEGFKSYGKRVEITGFDPAFNAITGLNGTGKSNILDSICFVLGLTNLSNVRASNLQELIFKHGQAGILVATVSITFDNRDKSQAPIGYVNTDEITVTRQVQMGSKNKYMINGINVKNKRVTDLFCSVQLNINNPHFLIMQGRITKVLNMKPPEILSMIEEAAGTSMYETKKKYAHNIINIQDAKLNELNGIIEQEIKPKLRQLKEERTQYQEHQQVVREIDGLQNLHKSYVYDQSEKKSDELKRTMDTVQEDINAKKENIKKNEKEVKKLDKEINEMNKKLDEVAELTEAVERDKVTQKETAALVRELEAKVKDIKGHREREFKIAEEELKKAKHDAQKHGAAWKNREQELETLRLETSELQQSVATSQSHLAETQQAADDLQQTLLRATEGHNGDLEAVKEMQARIEHQKTEISGRSTEVARRMQKMELLGRTNLEITLSIQELEFKMVELQTEFEGHQTLIKGLEKEHPWILQEKQYFGAPNGPYDFEAKQAQLAGTRLEQLHARRDKLARGLNVRAHTLLGKEEDQYKELISKKLIVEADRAKLVEVMEELDENKRQTLLKACRQVNKDFGAIFSTLLPAAQAELRAVDGGSVLDGLEVRVGFSDTWKSSLSELSGGQRSLVVLSLVLAMLLFKPAPLYILDDVDAALDLSHTQNIGLMLRNHFQHSQFIIVSLKDGMFNNANVLFRTRFEDGMSCVERIATTRH